MAVKIRLKRMGKIRTPFYRIVVADSRGKRDGRAIEEIGTYNPKADPSIISVESDRAQYWLSVGAQPTEAVVALLKLTGDWEKFSGEKQERKLEIAEPKRDKAEIFDEALKDLHAGEAKAEATTKKAAAAKKAEKKADEPKADEKPAEKKADAPKADKPAEAKAEKKADKPAEAKAEKKADKPAEAKADKPAEAKAEKKADKPAEAKADKPAEAKAEKKADKPAEAKADEPKADKPAADEAKA